MDLSSKQVLGDWDQTPPQSEVAELSKPMFSLPLQQEKEALKCPRCDSTNTKFCYYNNYNKSQPRHFCKSCKRHWTKGGTLRNVSLGGDRKNKRPKISNSATSKSNATPTKISNSATSKSNATPTTNAQHIKHNTDFPLVNSKIGDNKTMSSIVSTWFDEKFFMGTNNGTINNASVALENIPKTDFPFSSVSDSFELLNGSLIDPISYQSVNEYGNIFDFMDESTITTINIPTCPGLSTMDLTNSWNWNEIDVLASVDHLWDGDDEEVKP